MLVDRSTDLKIKKILTTRIPVTAKQLALKNTARLIVKSQSFVFLHDKWYLKLEEHDYVDDDKHTVGLFLERETVNCYSNIIISGSISVVISGTKTELVTFQNKDFNKTYKGWGHARLTQLASYIEDGFLTLEAEIIVDRSTLN